MKKLVNFEYEQLITEAMDAATWIWDLTTNHLDVNDRWLEMIGYERNELEPITANTWFQCLYEPDVAKAKAAIKDLIDGVTPFYRLEVRIKNKQGNPLWVLDMGKVIKRDELGNPQIVIGVHIDINDSKLEQQQKEENEKNLNEIINNTKDIIYRLSLGGHFTYLSKAFEDNLGFSIKAGVGTAFKGYVHPDDLPKINTFFEIIKDSTKHHEISDFRLITSKGQWRYYETSATTIYEDGKAIGYAGILRDISNLVDANQAPLESKKENKTFFDVSLDLLAIANKEGYFIKLNDTWEKTLGFTTIELMSKSYFEFVHPEDLVRTRKTNREVVEENEQVSRFINRYVCKDGTYKYLEWKTNAYDGKIYASARDVTHHYQHLKQVEYLSYHDQLTGFYNRHYLEKISPELSNKGSYPLAVISCDLNYLKEVNDTFGHARGDLLIKEAASLVRAFFDGSLCFRTGGD
ncbi:MAG TPA: hypothetical protein DEA45_01350 [Acholeplasmataceae bacterium]|nr:hypothetical protein [Acholeplasmataceae bacterium]